MLSDIRVAVRALARRPAFSLVAVGALALGVGANSAIFSVVNAALFRPAGIADPGRVVAVRVAYGKLNLDSIGMSAPNYADVRRTRDVFERAAILSEMDFNYVAGGMPLRLSGAQVSLEWFDVFGARPQLGRVFTAEEDTPNANQVVVLADAAWKSVFGGDPKILGRAIDLNGKPYRVIGVMPAGFRWPVQADLWAPLGLGPADMAEDNRFNESYFAVARLRPGIALERANAAARMLSDRVRNNGTRGGAYAKDSKWGIFCVPITDFVAGDSKTPMLILLGAVGMVLLIACANIAGLMLARASAQARDFAVRAALGAGRWALLRVSIAESAVLAAAGVAVGLALAFFGIRLLVLLAPERLAQSLAVRIDVNVLLFTAATGVLAAVLFGVAPAWRIWGLGRHELLKQGERAGAGRQRLRAALVAGEFAVALVLLVGAGLFLRTLANLQSVNPGFDPAGVMTGALSLPPARYAEPAQRIAFARALSERLAAIPGATSAALGIPFPFGGGAASASFSIEGRTSGPGDPGPHGNVRYVSPQYFSTLRIPVLAGRLFTDQDRPDTEPIVVIDETLAKQYWPNQDPVGKHMRRGSRAPWSRIAGVVGHVKHADLAGDTAKGTYYYSMYQHGVPFAGVLVRTDRAPESLAHAIREAVRAVDPAQPVDRLKSMPDLVAASLAPRRFAVTLLGFFAAAALAMAALGLYGVISYSVAQRTREIGIRMALGARADTVLGLVVGQGLRLAALGTAAGLAGAFAAMRLLRAQLAGVGAFDLLTFGGMVLVLASTALLASYLPARRAARLDPMVALRYE